MTALPFFARRTARLVARSCRTARRRVSARPSDRRSAVATLDEDARVPRPGRERHPEHAAEVRDALPHADQAEPGDRRRRPEIGLRVEAHGRRR